MLENFLESKNAGLKSRITVKAVISVFVVALAVALPQIVHIVAGASGGMTWLPMYFPILIGGCLLGMRWGAAAGIIAPLISFALTSAAGVAMPSAARLPFMTAELAVFAVVSGLFSNKIAQNALMAFPAVLLAQIGGRAVFMILTAIFQSAAAPVIWGQIQSGFIGAAVQAVAAPLAVILIKKALYKEKNND